MGQPLLFLDGVEKSKIGRYTSVLEDAKGELTIEDVLKSNDFIQCKSEVFSSIKTESTYWIKFQVKNLTTNQYYLVIDNPFINEIDFYIEGKEGISKPIKLGNIYPFEQRIIQKNVFIIPVHLNKDEIKTIYLRYYSTWRMELPLSFISQQKFIERSTLRDLWYGTFYGVVLVIFIYNLFLFITLRRKIIFAYLSLVVSLAIFRSLTHGFAFQYIFPNNPELNNPLIYIFFSILGIALIIFANKFLKTKEKTLRLYKIGYWMIALMVLLFTTSLINKNLWSYLSTIILLTLPIYLILIGIRVLRKGYLPARYYLLGTISYYLTIYIAALRNLGIFPYSFVLYNYGDIGLALNAIFLSIALGDQYNLLEKEKKETQSKLNRELELKIDERAKAEKEQSRLNESLRNTTQDLDNFIYTASHDLKSPITNIEGLINLIEGQPNDETEIKTLLNLMRTSVSKFKSTVNDLTEVAKVQQMRDENKEEINIDKAIELIKEKLKQQILESKAQISSSTADCPSITFSKRTFHLILEQLIDNAIKFRSQDRDLKINISTKETSNYNVLSVTDNGKGIEPKNQLTIFTSFRKFESEENKRGIGLYIIKRTIENEGGKIEVESKPGKGSTFSVYFKK